MEDGANLVLPEVGIRRATVSLWGQRLRFRKKRLNSGGNTRRNLRGDGCNQILKPSRQRIRIDEANSFRRKSKRELLSKVDCPSGWNSAHKHGRILRTEEWSIGTLLRQGVEHWTILLLPRIRGIRNLDRRIKQSFDGVLKLRDLLHASVDPYPDLRRFILIPPIVVIIVHLYSANILPPARKHIPAITTGSPHRTIKMVLQQVETLNSVDRGLRRPGLLAGTILPADRVT